VEIWEEEKGKETILHSKIKYYRIKSEMKKTISTSKFQQNKDKLYQGPNKAHKNTLKEEILQVINENFIEMLLDMVNQNVQEAQK
jgi:hypothetical protein